MPDVVTTPDDQAPVQSTAAPAAPKVDYDQLAQQAIATTPPSKVDYDRLAEDVKTAQTHVEQGKDVPHPLVERLLGWLPAIGGVAGGIVGGIGGTVGGVGVGGVPGAVGGAMVGGGAGEAIEQLGNRLIGNPAPATPSAAASGIESQAALQGGAEALGAGFSALAAKVAPWLMVKAAKPTAALLKDFRTTAPAIAQTLLNDGVNVTKSGADALGNLLNATQSKLRTLLLNSPAVIDKSNVAAEVLPTANRIAQQVNPTSDLQAVGDSVGEFLNNPASPGSTMSVADAQAMKTGTYQKLAGSYGEQAAASIETQKALARGLKNEIETAVPEAGPLNQQQAALMAAREAVAKQVGLAANRDPVGLTWITHNPATALGWLLEKSPAVKSFIARGLYQTAASATGVPANVIRLMLHSAAALPDGGTDQ